MKKLFLILAFAGLCISTAEAQKKIPHTHRLVPESKIRRTEIILPQVKGFNCYKGDFHVHTSYSDGGVTPAARITEAWNDGLDIVAITDHYEGQKGLKNTLKVLAPLTDGEAKKMPSASKTGKVWADFNAIHKEAEDALAKTAYPMLLIKGCEMARKNDTHGHFNCLFLKDVNSVYDPDMAKAFRNVKEQGGFIIHNHPGWRRKTSDKTEFHQQVYGEGLIDGVEVVNGISFYPHIVRRCIDEKLAMFANTDIHSTTYHNYISAGLHRTMTLVFAKDLTEKAVKDALLKGRTIAYAGGSLIGTEEWLSEFLNAAVDCRVVKVDQEGEKRLFQITNMSSITYRLRRGKTVYELEPFKSVMVTLGKDKKTGEYIPPRFRVDNMWHMDFKNPTFELELDK
jgi:predicted metal-dependent phosphoesterase TrpH